MGIVVGMDEAGYGPNLGPLVISATVWEVPGSPHQFDFWSAFSEVVDQVPCDGKLHVADSKVVYQPGRGLRALESSVHSLLALSDYSPLSLQSLCHYLTRERFDDQQLGPWLHQRDLELPLEAEPSAVSHLSRRWSECCLRNEVRLRAVVSDIVVPQRFNCLLAEHGSKGVVLSKLSMQLLGEVVEFESPQPTLVIADKHGGRNRYDHLLEEIAGDRFIVREIEGRAASCYSIGSTRIRFQTRAESHLPVAASSLVCKYIREGVMELFNRFWQKQLPGLKPTKGYPVDARRFQSEIADKQRELGIAEDVLWRQR